ncbi:hypothetical protein DITRI_Ditri01bG0185700 [Diplodiscus trichospermus]
MLNSLQTPTSSFSSAPTTTNSNAFRHEPLLSVVPPSSPLVLASPSPDPCLSKDQIIELFQNCIKLASENKINQKNTWELKLIDHLSEIIKADTVEGDAETNFQKASCTLEAGVKIYSCRFDALHADTCKVLGGIHRAGQEDQQVDPLYPQTSAQFDESGAKGLLLNNLGICEGCRVVFDSFEVPGKYKSGLLQNNILEMIDISFAKDAADVNVAGLDNSFGNCDSWTFDNDEVSSVVNEGSNTHLAFYDQHKEKDTYASCELDLEDRFEDVANFLSQGLGFTSKQNAWAGSQDIPATNVESALTPKKPKSKNPKDVDVDFTKNLDKEMPDVFVPPKKPTFCYFLQKKHHVTTHFLKIVTVNLKVFSSCFFYLIICVWAREEENFQVCSLYKKMVLAVLLRFIDVKYIFSKEFVIQKIYANHSSWQQNNDFDEALSSWDNESIISCLFNDGCVHDDVGNLAVIVSQPH